MSRNVTMTPEMRAVFVQRRRAHRDRDRRVVARRSIIVTSWTGRPVDERLRGRQLFRVDRLAVLVPQAIDLGVLKIGTPIVARAEQILAGRIDEDRAALAVDEHHAVRHPGDHRLGALRTCRAIDAVSDCSMRLAAIAAITTRTRLARIMERISHCRVAAIA